MKDEFGSFDITFCMDSESKLCKKCFRNKDRLSKAKYPFPVSFSHFKGTDSCLLEAEVKSNITDFGTLCICAERYALGRRTYITSEVSRIITTHLKDLSYKDLCILLKDLTEPFVNYGDPCDKQEWDKLICTLKDEIALRS